MDAGKLPDRTVVVRFELRDRPGDSYWLLLRKPTPELCTHGTGYVEDIVARTDAACLIEVHLKRISYLQALRSGRLSLEGPPQLTAAFMTWIRPSPYADVVPARQPRRPPGPHRKRPPRAGGPKLTGSPPRPAHRQPSAPPEHSGQTMP